MSELTCTWTHELDYSMWDTECGEAFTVIEGTPAENRFRFCCFCGKPLVERQIEEEETL